VHARAHTSVDARHIRVDNKLSDQRSYLGRLHGVLLFELAHQRHVHNGSPYGFANTGLLASFAHAL
jgi:hypothetical protein